MPAMAEPTAPMFTPPTGISRAQVAAALQQAPRTSAPPAQAAPMVPGAPRFSGVSQAPAQPQVLETAKKRTFPWWFFFLAIIAVAICSAGSVLGARGCMNAAGVQSLNSSAR